MNTTREMEIENISDSLGHGSLNLIPKLDPDFIESLQKLGVDESKLELSGDVAGEPVEILVNLAKNEEINPWDIDIVKVTDKFLRRIEEMKITDLRISGRTLLYASILLRMKSNVLVDDVEEEDEEEDGFLDEELGFYDIEEYPVPNLPVRRSSKRPVTLEELITELQKAERVETRRRDRIKHRKGSESQAVTTDEVLGIAHEENITVLTESLYGILEGMFEENEYVSFSHLLETGYGEDISDRIMTYISLLFLATEKKIRLHQREMFDELYISRNDAAIMQ